MHYDSVSVGTSWYKVYIWIYVSSNIFLFMDPAKYMALEILDWYS